MPTHQSNAILNRLQITHKRLEADMTTEDFYNYVCEWIKTSYQGNKEQWFNDTRCLLSDSTWTAFNQYILDAHPKNALGKIIQKYIPRGKGTQYLEYFGAIDIKKLHAYDYGNRK